MLNTLSSYLIATRRTKSSTAEMWERSYMFTKVVADTRSNSSTVVDGQLRSSPLVLTMFGQSQRVSYFMLDAPPRWQNQATQPTGTAGRALLRKQCQLRPFRRLILVVRSLSPEVITNG